MDGGAASLFLIVLRRTRSTSRVLCTQMIETALPFLNPQERSTADRNGMKPDDVPVDWLVPKPMAKMGGGAALLFSHRVAENTIHLAGSDDARA